jgi:creatinine amidohydrolase
MMLVVQPQQVRLDRAVAGNTTSLAELMPQLRAEGVRAASPSGVLGNPSGANAPEGEALLDQAAAQLIAEVNRWRP